jgi:predicted nucleic acid-binding protein
MITVGELRLGVLAAGDGPTRARRLETLSRAERFEPLPVNRAVAHAWAILRLALRAEGKRMPLNDSWIAATAIANRIPVVSQDDDYDGGPGTGSDPRLSTVSSPTKRSRLLRLIETDQTSETRNAQLIHPSRTPKIFPVLTTRLVGD